MAKNDPTPTPWDWFEGAGDKWIYITGDDLECVVARIASRKPIGDNDRVNARHIVKCVNKHARLVEALDAAMAFIDSHVADPDITAEMCKRYGELMALNPHKLLAELDKGEE